MLLRGRKVELIKTDGEHLIDRDEGFWILHFTRGEMLSRCEIILCRCRLSKRTAAQACHPNDLEEARGYYEGRTRFRAWIPQFSLGPWRQVALVSEIRYLRDSPPPFRHPFETPVRCYLSDDKPTTYKLTLPKGCIVNHHGFVEP